MPSIQIADGNKFPDVTIIGEQQKQSVNLNSCIKGKEQFQYSNPALNSTSAKLIPLGEISKNDWTVSHLLIKHPDFGKDCWKIIHSQNNQQKSFNKLQIGQKISLDNSTKEIIIENQITAPKSSGSVVQNQKLAATAQEQADLKKVVQEQLSSGNHQSISDSLKPLIGSSYNKYDCYELLAEGLENMGIKYRGKTGLGNHLIQNALDKGLPLNTYLTGEGLIKASSNLLYDKQHNPIWNSKLQAELFYQKIKPQLEPGLLVAFSTPRRGHTGVISGNDGQWTLLNSGILDNSVEPTVRRKGVGEEDLKAEITNWFKKAGRHHEPLRIMIGQLNEAKLAPFRKTPIS